MNLRLPTFLTRAIASPLIRRAARTPYFHLEGYMMRWWLVPYTYTGKDNCGPVPFLRRPVAWLLQRCGVAVRVHEILRSDAGRDFHDHPWNYVTLVLSGGYTEVTPNEDGSNDYHWYGPGSLMFRRADQMHRLLVVIGEPAVTLFITGRWLQPWGFYTETGKVHHKEYLARSHLRNQDVP